jgi:hypothetical protein
MPLAERREIRFDIVGPVAHMVDASNPGEPRSCRERSAGTQSCGSAEKTIRIGIVTSPSGVTLLLHLDHIGPPVAGYLGEPVHRRVEIVGQRCLSGKDRRPPLLASGVLLFLISCSSHCTSLKFSRCGRQKLFELLQHVSPAMRQDQRGLGEDDVGQVQRLQRRPASA